MLSTGVAATGDRQSNNTLTVASLQVRYEEYVSNLAVLDSEIGERE